MKDNRPQDKSNAHFSDLSLWDKVKRSVKPLFRDQVSEKNDAREMNFGSFDDALRASESNSVSSKGTKKAELQSFVKEPDSLKPSYPDVGSGLDGRTQRRLRQGKVLIDDMFDCHGLTQSEAHDAIITFIQKARLKRHRVILIITGKGRFSKTGESVLRKRLPEWMRASPLNAWVVDFTSAHKKHGGDGAFYVVLRRER
jgi:DNA-nicking Smr family endonuclease